MELVIKLSESAYKEMCEYGTDRVDFDIQEMIKSGTPLPKGHGRLKDEEEIFECIRNRVENLMKDKEFRKYRKDIDVLGMIKNIRNEVKTIIEAESEV